MFARAAAIALAMTLSVLSIVACDLTGDALDDSGPMTTDEEQNAPVSVTSESHEQDPIGNGFFVPRSQISGIVAQPFTDTLTTIELLADGVVMETQELTGTGVYTFTPDNGMYQVRVAAAPGLREMPQGTELVSGLFNIDPASGGIWQGNFSFTLDLDPIRGPNGKGRIEGIIEPSGTPTEVLLVRFRKYLPDLPIWPAQTFTGSYGITLPADGELYFVMLLGRANPQPSMLVQQGFPLTVHTHNFAP